MISKAATNGKVKAQRAAEVRCALYTRQSVTDAREEFSSLDAQREAAEAYVLSQRARGWRALPDRYDDAGLSGATAERPGAEATRGRRRGGPRGLRRGLQDRPAQPLDRRLRQPHGEVRQARRRVRRRHAAVRHLDAGRAPDAEPADLLRPVRTRDHRRTHARQGPRRAPARTVDGRPAAARLRRRARGRADRRERGRGEAGAEDLRAARRARDRDPHRRGAQRARLEDEGLDHARGTRARGRPVDQAHAREAPREPDLRRARGPPGRGLRGRAPGDRGPGHVRPRAGAPRPEDAQAREAPGRAARDGAPLGAAPLRAVRRDDGHDVDAAGHARSPLLPLPAHAEGGLEGLPAPVRPGARDRVAWSSSRSGRSGATRRSRPACSRRSGSRAPRSTPPTCAAR